MRTWSTSLLATTAYLSRQRGKSVTWVGACKLNIAMHFLQGRQQVLVTHLALQALVQPPGDDELYVHPSRIVTTGVPESAAERAPHAIAAVGA
jgi:hypothetical protein